MLRPYLEVLGRLQDLITHENVIVRLRGPNHREVTAISLVMSLRVSDDPSIFLF